MAMGYLGRGQQGLRELEDACTQDHAPPCVAACPVHVDVRQMAVEIGRQDFAAALKLLKRAIPFPGIVARVCDQPCAAVCKRCGLGGAVSIAALERACADFGPDTPERPMPAIAGARGVAVVGGGLSGATAALYLARKGHRVTLYEASARLGGSLWDLPRELLPEELIRREMVLLETVGVEVRIDTQIGVGVSLEDLCRQFGAVYLALGADSTECFGLSPDDRGRIAVDPATFATSQEGVFAGGTMRRPADGTSLIGALADGRYAAVSIDRHLQGASLTASRALEGSYTTRLFTDTRGVEPLSVVPAADPASGYRPEEAALEAGRCLRCECLECVKVCSYLAHYGSYPKKYARQIYNNLSIVSGKRTANRLINSCSLCGLCAEVCPERLDMGRVCLEAREIMVSRGKMPPSTHDFPIRDMLFSNGDCFAMARHQPGWATSAFLFFPGCQLAASSPTHVEATYSYLRERLSGGVGLMLGCCGAPAEWAGRSELFRQGWERMEQTWNEMGRPRWIVTCPSCQRVFRSHAPSEMESMSLWELMDELGLPRGCQPGDSARQGGEQRPEVRPDGSALLRVAVHDPCAARDDAGIQGRVRGLLAKLGYEVEELPLHGQTTECCGYGGLMSFANPQLGREVSRRRTEASAADYVTYCAMCRDRLAAEGKRSVHLLDLIFGSAADDPTARRGPGYSQRHENRARLKGRLLREVWGEKVEEPIGANTIRLSISPEVWARLESRLILVEDVQRVIEFAERTGRKLVNVDSGRFLAHFRPTAVTYWVEYSKEGDAFLLHNAYSHRMEILEEVRG